MPVDVNKNVENVRARINGNGTEEPNGKLTDEDQQALQAFDAALVRERAENDISLHHIRVTLEHTLRIALGTQRLAETLDDGEAGVDAIDTIQDWVIRKDISGRTIDMYFWSLRCFGDMLVDRESAELPERFEKLETDHRDTSDPTPAQTNILHWNDVVKLADAKEEYNYRDPALICVHWAAGTRPLSEMYPLTWGQIEDKGDHIIISLSQESKTGSRDIRVNCGVPYLRRWRDQHPAQNDGGIRNDTYVWTKLNANEHLTYNGFSEVMYDAPGFLDEPFGKPVNPQQFRRSRASVLAARESITQVDLEHHFGWIRGSDSARHYIAVFAQPTQKHIAMADGIELDPEKKPDPIAPVVCPGCGKYTPRHRTECIWCPTDITDDFGPAPDLSKNAGQGAPDLMAMIDDGHIDVNDLKSAKKLEEIIRARPDFWERLDGFISLLT